MQSFRDLVKPNTKFHWDETLDKLFQDSKALLITAVEEGIQSFDINRPTYLQTDWSKEGIGYLLLQKHCDCSMPNAPACCPIGWHLVYAGLCFTIPAECQYAPTEGEALAVAWGLEHAQMFVLGHEDLIVATDHQPYLGIFNDWDLGTITNPRIQDIEGKTLSFRFTIQYCPGKWIQGPDAVSRYPAATAIENNPEM